MTYLSVDKPASLWAATCDMSNHENAPLDEDISTDVAIIGAGFTGLRSALHLTEAGLNVAVLDAGDVGYGASGRTGGQVNPVLPFNTPKKLRMILGQTYFERLREASLGSADELFNLIHDNQIDCQARQKGWLRVCHNKKALADAKAGIEEWNQFGANMEIVGPDEINKLSGTSAYHAGVVTPKGGAVHPMRLAQGVAQAAKQRGCAIFGRSAALNIEKLTAKPFEHRWLVKTANGSINTQWVILATNGYTGDLLPKLAKTIIPITPIQIATDPLPNSIIGDILPSGHTISDSRRVVMYARREPDNRMVYGGHGRALPNGQIKGIDWLIKDAERVFPQLKGSNWKHQWWGRIAVTEDHLPHLYEPKPGILAGLGYNGRGVAMSHVMGRVMAERVLGKGADDLAFPISDIKGIPFRSLQVSGMSTVIRLMKVMDSLETR